MSFIKERRAYFFRANAPNNPNVVGEDGQPKKDNLATEGVPSQDTMERFTASHLNFRQRQDRAKQAGFAYTDPAGTFATPLEDFELVGHVQIATDVQVLAYESGIVETVGEETTRVVHPQQLTEDCSNPDTLDLDGVTNASSAPASTTETVEVTKDVAETRRNKYLYRISESFRVWLNGIVTNLTNINTYTYGTGGEDSPADGGSGLGGAIFGPGGTQESPTQPGLLTTVYGPSGNPASPDPGSLVDQVINGTLLPIGSVTMWVNAVTPNSDWLVCDGSTVSQTTYADLFAAIGGHTFGADPGGGNFILPDLQEKFVAGYSGAGDYTMGNNAGEDAHALTPDETAVKGHGHTHSLGVTIDSSGAHQHKIAFPTGPSAGGGDTWDLEPSFERATRKGWDGLAYAYTGTKNATSGGISPGGGDPLAFPLDPSHWDADGAHTHTGSVTGSIDNLADGANGTAHENRPAFVVMNYIIKAL